MAAIKLTWLQILARAQNRLLYSAFFFRSVAYLTGYFHKMVDFPVTKLLFSLLSIRYDEELVVPIIENTPEERDLKVSRT